MDNFPASHANGFDIYPLVYRYDPPRQWNERRPDRAYSASVVICREGQQPSGENGRVFRLPEAQWESVGVAKRAAVQRGLDIIGGLVAGESTAGL
ncbi:hypothetical protein DFLDMN_004833 [Cupriavidus sp. H19C3]|uniref:hypothetical protein n=1 Tax=Cupriavidus sp. H19C3 TaxID=3241603 RepID=UPI0011DA7595|nr:MAG: hypothetical protein E6Q40_06250 [Cupriavidus sp.]